MLFEFCEVPVEGEDNAGGAGGASAGDGVAGWAFGGVLEGTVFRVW